MSLHNVAARTARLAPQLAAVGVRYAVAAADGPTVAGALAARAALLAGADGQLAAVALPLERAARVVGARLVAAPICAQRRALVSGAQRLATGLWQSSVERRSALAVADADARGARANRSRATPLSNEARVINRDGGDVKSTRPRGKRASFARRPLHSERCRCRCRK